MFTKLTISALVTVSCLAQTTLRQYLSLTTAQTAAIVTMNQDFSRYLSLEQQQADSVNEQLSQLLMATVPDPQAIGTLAVRLEQLRRDAVSKQLQLEQGVAAQLTPAQISTLQNLGAAETLRSFATDATCAYLVKQNGFSWFSSAYFAPNIVAGDFTILNPFPYAPPALPYIPPAPTGSFCGSQVFPISIREYLNLTDPQVAALFAASAAYNDFYARQQNRLADINQQIASLHAARNTDPVAIGLLYAEMSRIGKAITDKSNQLRDAALTQLTPAQAAQVATLQQARDLYNDNVINTAIGCGLLTPSPGSPDYGNGPNGYCPL